jgi:hypothetical protein
LELGVQTSVKIMISDMDEANLLVRVGRRKYQCQMRVLLLMTRMLRSGWPRKPASNQTGNFALPIASNCSLKGRGL